LQVAVIFLLFLAAFFSSFLFLFWHDPSGAVLWHLRLPQLLLILGYGGALSLSGTFYQNALNNPLAEPFILGVASGAALGVGFSLLFGGSPELGALAGGLLTVLLLFTFSAFFRDSLSLLLFGVGLSSFFSAGLLFLFALMPFRTLQDAFLFTVGLIPPVSLKVGLSLFSTSLLFLGVSFVLRKSVDLLALGEELAFFSGVDPFKERVKLIVVSSAVVSLFIAYCGIVGFVGLMVPHFVRLLGLRSGFERLLASFLSGAATLTLAQFLATWTLYPTQLPVGVITGLIGAPAFLALLWRSRSVRG